MANSVSIKRITGEGETTEILNVSQEEYDQIISQYGTGRRSELKLIHYEDAFTNALLAADFDETLLEKNFNRVNTDGFEKAVVLLQRWADMTMREISKKRNFRIEINYNAKAKKTDFAIYTPSEYDSSRVICE